MGNQAISPWVALSQIHFPILLGVSGSDFPPRMMWAGLHRGTSVLVCCVRKKKKLVPGMVGKLFLPKAQFLNFLCVWGM